MMECNVMLTPGGIMIRRPEQRL